MNNFFKKTGVVLAIGILLAGCSNSSNTSSSENEKKEDSTQQQSSQQKEDKLPDIKADQMQSFIDYFKNDLVEKGLNISDYTFYNKDTVLYMTVPEEYKTYGKENLQNFGDGMLQKEHEAFNVWAGINGVNFERYPMFHIKTESGDSLISQKMSGKMEVKVK